MELRLPVVSVGYVAERHLVVEERVAGDEERKQLAEGVSSRTACQSLFGANDSDPVFMEMLVAPDFPPASWYGWLLWLSGNVAAGR